MPAKSWSRWTAMTSSRAMNRATRPGTEPARGPSMEIRRGSWSGTLTRANSSLSLTGFRTTTARFRERPEM